LAAYDDVARMQGRDDWRHKNGDALALSDRNAGIVQLFLRGTEGTKGAPSNDGRSDFPKLSRDKSSTRSPLSGSLPASEERGKGLPGYRIA
jgi:hypothetical protein